MGIAAALIQPSDVLLLDEPTNHIDNDTVQLLEEQLRKYRGAIVMVTHDRYFLNRITQKIVEVDRGKIYEYNGSYSTYLEQKAQREADAEAQERKEPHPLSAGTGVDSPWCSCKRNKVKRSH